MESALNMTRPDLVVPCELAAAVISILDGVMPLFAETDNQLPLGKTETL